MRFDNLASLSAIAAFLLQMGTFVNANPLFVDTPSSPVHSNDAANADSCQDVRITFPASSDIVFENSSMHVVAWQLPQNTFKQVNLTLVNEENSNDIVYLGQYDANRGASNETNFLVTNPGNYHVNLVTLGGPASCQTSSIPFAIKPSSQKVQQEEHVAHVDAEKTDEVIKDIRQSSSKSNEQHNDDVQKQNWEAALKEIDAYLKQSKAKSHSNEEAQGTTGHDGGYPTFDQFIQDLEQDYHKYIHKNKETEDQVINHKNDADQNELHSDSPYFTNTDRRTHVSDHLNAEIDILAGSTKHNDDGHSVHPNNHLDAELNDLMNQIKSQSKDHSHVDAEVNEAMSKIKSQSSDHEHLDADINAIIAELKSETSQPSNNNHLDAEIDEVIRNIKGHSNAGEEIHNDRLNAELNSMFETHDDGDWSIEEIHQDVEWIDQSVVPDHSNEGQWIAEEVDPNAVYYDHKDSVEMAEEKDFDHSNIGEWIAEEIQQTPEPKETENHMDAATGEWFEVGSAPVVPDHSNAGEWVAEEIDDEETHHRDAQWFDEHTDAEPTWSAEDVNHSDEEPVWIANEAEHKNAGPMWIGEPAEHSDSEPAWMAEEESHPNAEPNWVAEQVGHSDSEPGWVAEDGSTRHLDDNIAIYSAEELIN
ncbi:hypothetical protein BX666DRAFT_1949003 [Dichotomocladium elegans]|nr:hypothetical protein BX666DRAFT_1949003 [Dichotomocladium elegans]